MADKANDMIDGLSMCTGEKADEYTNLATIGKGYLQTRALDRARECGVDVAVDINATSCMGAVWWMDSMEHDCPRWCSDAEAEEDRDGLPFCDGQPERNQTSCGTAECANAVQS